MKYEDVKIRRITVETNAMGVKELENLDSVVLFGVQSGEVVMGAIGEISAVEIIEMASDLGSAIGAGLRGLDPALRLTAAKVAARALIMGSVNGPAIDKISAASAANEVVFGIES